MKIQIQGSRPEITEALKTHVLRRLGFALSRFGEKVTNVLVRFSKVKNPRGDTDKRCQIDVDLRRSVTSAGTDANVLVAVDRAAERAGRSVARALERENDSEDPRRPPRRRK